MVDALVAVVIVSLMLSIALMTHRIGMAQSRTGQTMAQASVTLDRLMETTPRSEGLYRGQMDGFSYLVTVREDRVDDMSLCRLKAEVRRENASYVLSGTRWCQAQQELGI